MASDLYKTARLIQSDKFNAIVEAAMVKYASSLALGGTLTNEKNFAIWVLKNPMQKEISMTSLVATDATVLAAAEITEGDYLNVDNIPDSAVINVVTAKWSLVATKYPATSPV
jgi:hypothetical protein